MANPIFVTLQASNGRKAAFQVFVGADGAYYLHDPLHLIDAEHGALPFSERQITSDGRLGASPVGSVATAVIPTALSFVPVVGPILGPIASVVASLVGGMFGGNDPTPPSTLWGTIIQLRRAIQQARQTLGISDPGPPPPGPWASKLKGNQDAILATQVLIETFPNNVSQSDINHAVCDFAGVNCPGCGNWRKCLYATINKLQPLAQQLGMQAHDYALKQTILAAVPGGTAPLGTQPGAVAPSASPPSVTANPAPIVSGPLPLIPGASPSSSFGPPFAYGPSASPTVPTFAPSTDGTAQSSLTPGEAAQIGASGQQFLEWLPLLLGGGLIVVAMTQKQHAPRSRTVRHHYAAGRRRRHVSKRRHAA